MAQLLDHRYSAELPTILTAAAPPETLERREGHPLARLDDSSLLERLRGALIEELTGREEGFVAAGRLVVGRPVKPCLSHILA